MILHIYNKYYAKIQYENAKSSLGIIILYYIILYEIR